MKKLVTTLVFGLVLSATSFAQDKFPPVVISEGVFLGETIPLRDMPTSPEWNGGIGDIKVVPNNMLNAGKVRSNALPIGPDPLVQTEPGYREASNLILDFVGANINESGGFLPPDVTGAVGPNHYVHGINVRIKIFAKDGSLLAGPIALSTFLGSGNNDGDPIVMYDQLADRFFVSQFRVSDNALIIGVSSTPDPTGTFFVYEYPLSSFPDYPHYSVWPDGYYLTANKAGLATYAFERDVMLAGGPSPGLRGFNLGGVVRNPGAVFSPEPANLLGQDFPEDAPGYIVYLQDDAWPGITTDHIKVWEIDLDWEGSSTISAPLEIPTEPFDANFQPFGTGNVNQPGTNQRIDAIGGVISYMANYRSFEDHNSFLINFNVDIDGNDTVGIRWIELRNSSGTEPFSIYQESTYTIADGDSRFMGSMGIDDEGNIALAYNVGSAVTRAGIRYTGRMENDPLGQMTFPETSIIEGNGVQTFSNRFGDYAQMTIDLDNRTFWHTAQYFQSNNTWTTRIAALKLQDDLTNDVGVYNVFGPAFEGPYSATESITAALSNYGTATQTNFPLELYVNETLVATETFTGSLAAGDAADFTFAQTVDMSSEGVIYKVEVRTALSGDEAPSNDESNECYLFGEVLGTTDVALEQSNLLIYPLENRVYEINFATQEDFGNMSYKVVNMLGQEISRGDLPVQSNGYKTSVNLGTSANGVYVVEVSNGTQSVSKQILVN